jgi:putative membrane protein
VPARRRTGWNPGTEARSAPTSSAAGRYRGGVASNEVMDFDSDPASASRFPRGVYDEGREPDPLYTLANERTYLSWLRLAVTLLAAAVAIDRLFLENPWYGSQVLALGLVVIAVGTCGLAVRRWWATEQALRRRQPLPGFGTPFLGVAAILLTGLGVILLVLTPAQA